MYERLLSAYQLVAFQETKFNKEDSLQTNEHFIHTADSGARCFWSDTTTPVFNKRHGVGLVLSSASPFGEVDDITARAYKEQLQNRYLLLKTTLGNKRVFIHVVYAPDEPMHRGEFFRALPTQLDDDAVSEDDEDGDAMHIVLGDFNTTLDTYLDQASPSQHHPGTGREELCDWLDALGLVDAWRFMNPEDRDFTTLGYMEGEQPKRPFSGTRRIGVRVMDVQKTKQTMDSSDFVTMECEETRLEWYENVSKARDTQKPM
ncbi:putative pollike protein [Phytophthora cinnamomi]|uniref:putative pollike protein n=1 Tax=Phytophthora cinnamomi TaxID=4785 RepID=UPI00355A00BC|nr:putative pollike protein [Phytophthora cinnamomi]